MNRHRMCIAMGVIALMGVRAAISQQDTNSLAGTRTPPGSAAVSAVFTNDTVESFASKTNLTEITSKQMRMDMDKKIAHFDGDVVVLDPSFLLRANRLIVFLNPNGSGMERAEAYDDVIIVQDQEKRKARGQNAVYTTADGRIVLTGDPSLENETGITRGEKITIFRTNNIVLVEGGTRTVVDLNSSSNGTNATHAATATNEAPHTETK